MLAWQRGCMHETTPRFSRLHCSLVIQRAPCLNPLHGHLLRALYTCRRYERHPISCHPTYQLRDLRAIYNKVVQVLRPSSQNAVLRDWDLWGPLLFTITLAILLSLDAPPAQSLTVFTGVFVIVSVGSVVVTLNCKLLGGKV